MAAFAPVFTPDGANLGRRGRERVRFGQVGIESLLSSPLASVGPPTAHLAFASEDQTGFSGTWTLTSQAICASA